MVFVKYVGDADEVVTPANGGVPVLRDEVVEIPDSEAGGLVGDGSGLWVYVDAPAVVDAPASDAPAAAAEEN